LFACTHMWIQRWTTIAGSFLVFAISSLLLKSKAFRMGTWAKMLGQASARSLESESRNILRTAAANKIPGSLSLALDGTLKQGHDMKVFGFGTVAALANRSRYSRFTSSMLSVYGAMEAEFDKASPDAAPAVHAVWSQHKDILRRAPALQSDLADVSSNVIDSPATERYVAGIRAAGEDDRARGGARLLGHLYCRYFADLFGGQMLGYPTQLALALPAETPRHYIFSFPGAGRREYIEEIYVSLNAAGKELTEEGFEDVVQESLKAFNHNKDVYGEEPYLIDAARGSLNVCTGYMGSLVKR